MSRPIDQAASPVGVPAGDAAPDDEVGQVRLHLFVAAVCLVLVILALLLQPAEPGAGRLTVGGLALPEVCAFKQATGLPCPGCGLTRSWVSALHGDLAASALHHPLGWLVLLYALAQAARHLLWVSAPGERRRIEAAGRWLDRGIVVLAGLLLVAWVPTLVGALGG